MNLAPQGLTLQSPAIERIHELALDVLARVGIVVHYAPARALLRDRGALVDEKCALVRIPRGLVEQALRVAPRAITLHSLNDPTRDCELGVTGGRYTRPASGLNWIVDAGSPYRRAVTEADAIAWARLAEALPNIHCAAAAYDQSGSPQAMEVRAIDRLLRHSRKPLMMSAVSGEGMRWVKRLIEVTQSADRPTRAMVLSSVNSPLIYSHGQCEAAMVSAELGIPVLVNSSAVAGVTAPVTLAGDLVVMHAEMLAALTIIELHRPGAPVIYTGHPVIMDMRSGQACFGFAEIGLLAAACVDIGRHVGLPTGSDGLTTDSAAPDAQAASEKWSSGYLPMLAGANINGGAGALASQSTISLEQLVLDDEIYGHILRQARGVAVDEEALAADLIARVGAGGSFLAEEHTLRHFRSEMWYSRLASRQSAPVWEAAGARDALARANEQVRQTLAVPTEPLLSDAQSRELATLVARAEESLSRIEIPI